jgi:microcystin-dependent protein
MPRNGSGTYTLPQAAFVPSTTISSAAVNSDLSDIAAQITNSLAADGQTTMTGQLKAQTGSASAPAYSFGSDLNTGFYSAGNNVIGVAAGGAVVGQITLSGFSNTNGAPLGVPIGAVMDFAGTAAPAGWLLCFGQSVATATYPDLFAAIAYTYGGSGPNFSIPDCRGRATFGKDNMGGVTAGRITVAGGNFNATVLGATGGSQNQVIAQSFLPNVNFTISGITINPHSHTLTIQPVTLGGGGTGSNQTAAILTGSTSTSSTTATINNQGTAASGGSGTAFAYINPAIVFNKIIFAGV